MRAPDDLSATTTPEPLPRPIRPCRLHHEPAALTWAREKAGLSRRGLAERVGVSGPLIGGIESGWLNATPANLTKIAVALNCPVVLLERRRQ